MHTHYGSNGGSCQRTNERTGLLSGKEKTENTTFHIVCGSICQNRVDRRVNAGEEEADSKLADSENRERFRQRLKNSYDTGQGECVD